MSKYLLFIFIIPLICFSSPQSYSDKELNEYRLANNSFIVAKVQGNMDSLLIAVEKFQTLIKKYPDTIVKNGIIGHLFDAYTLIYSNQSLLHENIRITEYPRFAPPERIKELGELLIKLDPQHFTYHAVAEGFCKCGLFLDDAIIYVKKAISKLSDNSNLHTPEYYYTLGKLYLQVGDNDSAIKIFSFADSILAQVPDEKYRYSDTKNIQGTKIKLGLAMSNMVMGNAEKAVSIYRELYLNNLDYESLENQYKSSLLALGIDSASIEQKLNEERNDYLNDIVFQLKQGSHKRMAQSFTLQNLAGKDVSLQDFSGKVVVLNFWAGWCAPCLVEMPILAELHREFSQLPVAIVAVNIETNNAGENYQDIISKYNIGFIILKGNSSILSQYNVPPIPKTYILDKKGNIRYEHFGTSGSLHQQLRLEITELIAE